MTCNLCQFESCFKIIYAKLFVLVTLMFNLFIICKSDCISLIKRNGNIFSTNYEMLVFYEEVRRDCERMTEEKACQMLISIPRRISSSYSWFRGVSFTAIFQRSSHLFRTSASSIKTRTGQQSIEIIRK